MKKNLRTALSLALAVLLCMCLPSCATQRKKYTNTYFDVFDSFATITVYNTSESNYQVYNEIFRSEIESYHKLLDAYNEYDGVVNLCTVNKTAANDHVKVSGDLFEFIDYAINAYSLTGGYTSITIGAVTQIWKNAISSQTLPDQSALDEASKHVDISSLQLDYVYKTVYFSDSELSLDCGALAKGFVAKVLYYRLIAAGCESFLVNIGGTLCAFGQKNDGTDWYGGIQSPFSDADMDIAIDISNKALSTSGSYQRGFDLDGVRYHHIIDPITLYPKNDFLSVSVICASAADADALSTALFCMSLDEGKALIEKVGAEAVWILSDMSVVATDGVNIE